MAIISTIGTILLEVTVYLLIGIIAWIVSCVAMIPILRKKYGRVKSDYATYAFNRKLGVIIYQIGVWKCLAIHLFGWVYYLPIRWYQSYKGIEKEAETMFSKEGA